ncbi:hypothetical protein LCGC14_0814090 [marine sediment metagenome]|uniref:Uncharacterized protein n=1 Tax=marine sediment metagenome TaxID=412755 RepID=A0A0F9S5R6_9ZZZZ
MPYITPEDRALISLRYGTQRCHPCTAGELNFVFTELILEYLEVCGLSYQTCNDIIGALEQAKDEFRRRVVHRYEDIKIEENGDVYDPQYTGEGQVW